jgi:carbamoyltransferase
VTDYFELETESPYMLMVAPVKKVIMSRGFAGKRKRWDRLREIRSTLPAITHVDYSARIQTVDARSQSHALSICSLRFEETTGCGVLVNTSFNVRGEPIVCTPDDAYRCFMNTEMDVLVLEDFVLAKTDQPERPRDESWKREFELD